MKQRYLRSNTGAELNVYTLLPKKFPRGIINVTHGMVEHAGRYERFAAECAAAGYAVFSHDLRGHGNTKAVDAPLGRFSSSRGFQLLIEDQNTVIDNIKNEFPVSKVFVFEVDEDELVQRILLRGQTSGRTDDTEGSIKVRFEIYMQDTEPLINFYHRQEKVTKINAVGDVDEIYQNIAENLNKYL